MNIDLHMTVNDEYGNFIGDLHAVNVWHENEIAMDLASPSLKAPKVWIKGKVLHFKSPVLEMAVPFLHHGTHVGNLIWDSFTFTDLNAAIFLNGLRKSRYANEGGWCSTLNVWDNAEPITAKALVLSFLPDESEGSNP